MTSTTHRPLRAAALIAALLTGPCREAALGQEVDPRSTARAHVGPLYFTPRLALQDFGVDSNPFRSVDQPDADFAFTVIPAIDVAAGFRRLMVTGRSETDLVYFAKHDTERSINQDVGATASWSARRIALRTELSYLNTRRRAGDEIDARARREDRTGEVGIQIGVSPKLVTEVSLRSARMTFDPNAVFDDTRLAEALNRDTRRFGAAIRYAVTPLTTLAVSGATTRTRFLLSHRRDSESWRAAIGASLHPRALIGGIAEVGYEQFRPASSDVPGFSGPVGYVDLSSRPLLSTTFGIRLDRALTYSYAEREPYYVAEGFGGTARRQLASRWDLELTARRAWHRYRRIAVNPGGLADGRTDRLFNTGAALGYRARRDTRLSFGVSYWQRRSNQRDYFNFDGVRIGTTVVYGL